MDVPENLNEELYDAAERISALDGDMQRIHDRMVQMISSAVPKD